MKNIGIIGFGSMGSMLAEALLRNEVIKPSRLYLYSRTPQKYKKFCLSYPEVVTANTISELVQSVKYIFVCVPPLNVKAVLEKIAKENKKDSVIISFAASVTLDCIGSVIGEKISRIIPNITAEVDEGVFLACHGQYLDIDSIAFIERLLSYIGVVHCVPESEIELYTDITSCSPGIFSSIFQKFIESAQKFGKIEKDLATEMFTQSLFGVTKLYKDKRMGFEETISRVARKGGVTEVGISVISEKQPEVFDEVFEKTLENHRIKKQRMLEEYGLTSRST